MSLNPKTSIAARNLALNAIFDVLNTGGKLRLYDGVQPATVDTAMGAQVKLSEHALASTAYVAASGGTKTAAAIANGTGLADSTATWYQLVKADGTTRVHEGSVGTSASDLVLDSVAIRTGATVVISGLVHTMAA